MGLYLEPDDAKRMTQVEALKILDTDVVDEMYILPAEETLKEVFRLQVNTDGEPWAWAGVFDNRADLRTQYWADCKRAVRYIVDRMALNPHGFAGQSSAGISVSYGSTVPDAAYAVMARWAKTGMVYRS